MFKLKLSSKITSVESFVIVIIDIMPYPSTLRFHYNVVVRDHRENSTL